VTTDVSHRELAGWQLRAVTRLAELLAAHRDLPLLTWTVSSAGVVGRVEAAGGAAEVRAAFDAWCEVVGAGLRAERPDAAGWVDLWATARTGGVTVSLTATAFADGDGAGR
jgi:hypothetical protein